MTRSISESSRAAPRAYEPTKAIACISGCSDAQPMKAGKKSRSSSIVFICISTIQDTEIHSLGAAVFRYHHTKNQRNSNMEPILLIILIGLAGGVAVGLQKLIVIM